MFQKVELRLFKQKVYRGADKSLDRPGRKQARKHVREARDFNNMETRAVIQYAVLVHWYLTRSRFHR